jgi:hypothetical protein
MKMMAKGLGGKPTEGFNMELLAWPLLRIRYIRKAGI